MKKNLLKITLALALFGALSVNSMGMEKNQENIYEAWGGKELANKIGMQVEKEERAAVEKKYTELSVNNRDDFSKKIAFGNRIIVEYLNKDVNNKKKEVDNLEKTLMFFKKNAEDTSQVEETLKESKSDLRRSEDALEDMKNDINKIKKERSAILKGMITEIDDLKGNIKKDIDNTKESMDSLKHIIGNKDEAILSAKLAEKGSEPNGDAIKSIGNRVFGKDDIKDLYSHLQITYPNMKFPVLMEKGGLAFSKKIHEISKLDSKKIGSEYGTWVPTKKAQLVLFFDKYKKAAEEQKEEMGKKLTGEKAALADNVEKYKKLEDKIGAYESEYNKKTKETEKLQDELNSINKL